MASLFSAVLTTEKFKIKIAMNNLQSATKSNQEKEALKHYGELKDSFQVLSNSLSIASVFEKMKVKSLQQSVMKKADALLAQKGWTTPTDNEV